MEPDEVPAHLRASFDDMFEQQLSESHAGVQREKRATFRYDNRTFGGDGIRQDGMFKHLTDESQPESKSQLFSADDVEGTRASQLISGRMGLQSDELPARVAASSDEEFESSEDESDSGPAASQQPVASQETETN